MGYEQHRATERMEIAYSGSLTAETVGDFRALVDAALASGARIIELRLHALDQLDSSGVGAIVFLHRRLTIAGRRLTVEGLQGQPLSLARLIRLDVALGMARPTVAPRRRLRFPRLGRILPTSNPSPVAVKV